MTIRRALLSVSDKTGLVDFARRLHQLGFELLSTGGTARTLRDAGLPVTDVSAVTGFPEIMDGRVKTLHPRIHGGLLGRPGTDDAVMAEHGIAPIEIAVINLYPFAQTIARPDCTRELAIENIDIGGPAMVRAAAKNHAHVGIVVDPADYDAIASELEREGRLSEATRRRLAARAFAHTAAYDAMVAEYLSADEAAPLFPAVLTRQWHKRANLRYGENPHQGAAFYTEAQPPAGTVAASRSLQGKPLSFNNIADADAALECVKEFALPACVIVKHANPCGVAQSAEGIRAAYDAAFATDPTSAFGGIIAFNRPLDADTARWIIERQFAEVIIAPGVAADALEVTAAKPNLRVLDCGELPTQPPAALELRSVGGGLLVQQADRRRADAGELRCVTHRAPDERELADLLFAWRVVKYVKSNAIVYARGQRTIGIGAGQMSRVWSARIAAEKAAAEGLTVAGSVMASDAFFPFRDGIDAAAAAGIRAVIQPGGSVRDEEVIAAANEHGIAMVFTGVRHFRH